MPRGARRAAHEHGNILAGVTISAGHYDGRAGLSSLGFLSSRTGSQLLLPLAAVFSAQHRGRRRAAFGTPQAHAALSFIYATRHFRPNLKIGDDLYGRHENQSAKEQLRDRLHRPFDQYGVDYSAHDDDHRKECMTVAPRLWSQAQPATESSQ